MSFRNMMMILSVLTIGSTACAIDLPHFYRTTFFQGEAKRNTSDFATHLEVRYAEGTANKAWNTREVKTGLFDGYCAFDLRKLADNIECLDQRPLTKAYAQGPIPQLFDGTLAFDGRFYMREIDITIQQNLMHGLYLQAYLPIRKLKIDCIDHCQSATTQAEHDQLVAFVENELDAILNEHEICPLKTPFCATELSDPLISIGWHGNCKISDSVITALRGYVQAGVIIPTGSKRPINRVFGLPFGYNKHWGFNARANVHATLWDKLVLGANAGVIVFMKQTYDQRVTTTPDQSGWIMLEKARASTDLGTMWDATAYLKIERLFGGFSALIGYSYTQQEDTHLTVYDPCYLKTAKQRDEYLNKNDVANTNKMLKQWYQHVLHGYVQYDFSAHKPDSILPTVRAAYHLPILAKHTWHTDMWSGSGSLSITWEF